MNKSLGQIAYEAFTESIKQTPNVEPVKPLIQWDFLFMESQAAWEAAAVAVTAAVLNKPVEIVE